MESNQKAAILIISDTAFKDPTLDRTAGVLAPIFAREGKWEPPAVRIVPNNVSKIQQAVCDWSDGSYWYDLILLSSTTGFGVKDNTPEAITTLIHRHVPNLLHGMVAETLKLTPFTKTARPFGGIREKSLIITLPGYPIGAMERLEAVLKLLPHAFLQNSRSLHTSGVKGVHNKAGVTISPQLQHHHQHAHGHGIQKEHISLPDKSQSNPKGAAEGADQRCHSYARPAVSVEEALRIISERTPASTVVDTPVTTSIIGSVIAEDVYAAEMVPAYRSSSIDGYAITAEEGKSTKGVFLLASFAHAKVSGALEPLQPRTAARVTIGAPLPPNANAVVMVEDTASSTIDGQEEASVEILADDIVPGENVREPGSDIGLNSKILARGDLISPAEISLLAATGTRIVKIFKKPRVGVLSIGDELVEYSDPCTLVGGQIRDSNRPSLLSCLASWGFETVDLGIARGPSSSLEHSLHSSLRGVGRVSSSVDVLVTTGGVSMNNINYNTIIELSLGGTIHFDRVFMKPGMSTTFATVPLNATETDAAAKDAQQEHISKLIFSLPETPSSALLTLNLFVLSSLHKLAGLGESSQAIVTKPWIPPQLGLPRVAVVLTHHFHLDPKRTEYHRAVVTGSRSDGRLYATSIGVDAIGQPSPRIGSLAKANALVVLRPGRGVGIKGEIVEALMMGPIHGSDTRIIC
ncbi:hypothetical protein N7522_010437 [Penicillium canescens]|nr:hypothetical protein N7522_010437 [Penicillium canescens]